MMVSRREISMSRTYPAACPMKHWPVRRVLVSGDSMRPALEGGDRLLVVRSRRLRVGDVAKDFPNWVFERMGELGFLGLHFPEEYGGSGGDYLTMLVLSEEMARCGSGGVSMAVSVQCEYVTPPILKFGTEEQKERWLMPAIAGRRIGALGITEPGAGSDVAG